MNADWEKLASCDQDVTNIMQWWLVKKADKRYLRMAMLVGGVNEVVQETCLAILNTRPSKLSCSWTTATINKTRWTLLLMLRNQMTREGKANVFLREISHDLIIPDIQTAIAMRKELAERMELCMKCLSHREKVVLDLRMQDMTLEEVSYVLKVSRERVRQIEGKAIRKLKAPNVSGNLVMFLDG